MIKISYLSDKSALLSLDNPHKSVNVLNALFLIEFEKALEPLLNDSNVPGIILSSNKKDFLAGADLEELMNSLQPGSLTQLAQRVHQITRRIEKCGKPVVAAVNGSALGGGLEMVLACHYRIALNQPRLKLGLPEVTLGLLPGGGGTQRLPRLIGIANSLPILLEGRPLAPAEALKLGIIQELAESPDQMLLQAQQWIKNNPQPQALWDKKDFKYSGFTPHSSTSSSFFLGASANLRKKTYNLYPAAQYILSSVYEGTLVDIDNGLSIETRYFEACGQTPQAKAMTKTFFFNLNKANSGGARPQGIERAQFQHVGVLGAGMMGAGIAYICALNKMNVYLKDATLEGAQKGKAYSQKILDEQVFKGKLSSTERDAVLDRIHCIEDAAQLKPCQIIIEAVFEDRALKEKIIIEVEKVVNPQTIWASNTSTLPITSLAKVSLRPQQFIGLHFFSPVEKMPLLEIIMGQKTSQQTLAQCFDFCLQIKKTPMVVQDSRGFFTSRVFATYVLEGIACLKEGLPAELIENAGKACGMPLGPLALADEVSLDLLLHIQKQTLADLKMTDQKPNARDLLLAEHPANAVVERMIGVHKRHGKKSQAGFYNYPAGAKKHIWPELKKEYAAAASPSAQNISALQQLDQLKNRLLNIQVIESIRCLEEGILSSPADGDVGSILGWGFAPYTGGVFSYADQVGAATLIAECQRLAQQYGPRFLAPALLTQMHEQGKKFHAT